MAELVLFNAKAPSSFTATRGTLITAKRVVLRWEVTVTGSPTSVQWYMEFGGGNGKNPKWYRETAEEDQGDGDVHMPAVLRTLMPEGGGNLPVGTHLLDMQFTRDEQLVRVQLMSPGNATVKLTTPYGGKLV